MALPYTGAADFRGYLNYLGQNNNGQPGDAMASNALNFVGSDADFRSGGGVNEGYLRQYTAGATGNPADDQAGYDRYKGYITDRWNEWNGSQNDGQLLGTNNTRLSGSGSGTGSNTAQELEGLNSQQSLYERLLESINGAEQNGINSLNDSENSARNNANTQRSRAMEDFAVKRQSTERGRDSALTQVGDNSRMLRDSLMRRLGLGAGGGSAFQMGDQAVARDASKNREGVLNSYGENFMQLGTSEKRADEDYASLLEEIAADRRAKEQSLKGGILGQRQGIQESLGQIAGDRANLQGGNPISASAPYRNNYLSLQGQVDQLPQQYRTQVDARALNVQTPTLKDYVVDRAAINQQKQSGQQQYSPYSQFLNRNKDEDQLSVR